MSQSHPYYDIYAEDWPKRVGRGRHPLYRWRCLFSHTPVDDILDDPYTPSSDSLSKDERFDELFAHEQAVYHAKTIVHEWCEERDIEEQVLVQWRQLDPNAFQAFISDHDLTRLEYKKSQIRDGRRARKAWAKICTSKTPPRNSGSTRGGIWPSLRHLNLCAPDFSSGAAAQQQNSPDHESHSQHPAPLQAASWAPPSSPQSLLDRPRDTPREMITPSVAVVFDVGGDREAIESPLRARNQPESSSARESRTVRPLPGIRNEPEVPEVVQSQSHSPSPTSSCESSSSLFAHYGSTSSPSKGSTAKSSPPTSPSSQVPSFPGSTYLLNLFDDEDDDIYTRGLEDDNDRNTELRCLSEIGKH